MKHIFKNKKKNKKRKHPLSRNIRPKLEGMLTAFIAIALIFFSTYLVHVKSMESLVEEIKIGLKSNVMSAATTIDGDLHTSFNASTGRKDSVYIAQITPLENIRINAKDIRYIYTNILVDEKVYFILNPSPQNDNDGDGEPDLAPALMEVYDDPSPALVKALKENVSTVSGIYEDKWGVFISAYAPFYNKSGELVGTLGMDLELNNFYERLQPIKIAFEKTVLIIIFIGVIIGLLIWYIRIHAQVLLGYKETSSLRIKQANLEKEEAYRESITIMEKIDQQLWNKEMQKKISSWLGHIMRYQNSKILSVMELEHDFEFYQLVQELEENIERTGVEVKIISELKYPLKICGASKEIYRNAIVEILSETSFFHADIPSKVKFLQLEEGVDSVFIECNVNIPLTKEKVPEIHALFYPKIEAGTKDFNAKQFDCFIAVQVLKKANCKVHITIENSRLELRIIMEMRKPTEIEF